MIDLHTHILPGIDDGPGTVEDSLQMAELLFQKKVDCAVCTPHFDPMRISLEEFTEHRSQAISLMNTSPIRLICASETKLQNYLFHYSDLSRLCIEGTGYLLLELPHLKKYDAEIKEQIERLTGYYNLVPILAHMERYPEIKNNDRKALKEAGCVIQMNSQAVILPRTRKKALKEIRAGFVDVLGSDCHDLIKRPPDLWDAFTLIKNKLGTEYCDLLEYNAGCIINGIELRKKNPPIYYSL